MRPVIRARIRRDTCGFAEMEERLFRLDMLHSVVFFSGFAIVPAVESADEVSCSLWTVPYPVG